MNEWRVDSPPPHPIFFLTLVHGMRDSSSLTRDRIYAPYRGCHQERARDGSLPGPAAAKGVEAGRLKDVFGARTIWVAPPNK